MFLLEREDALGHLDLSQDKEDIKCSEKSSLTFCRFSENSINDQNMDFRFLVFLDKQNDSFVLLLTERGQRRPSSPVGFDPECEFTVLAEASHYLAPPPPCPPLLLPLVEGRCSCCVTPQLCSHLTWFSACRWTFLRFGGGQSGRGGREKKNAVNENPLLDPGKKNHSDIPVCFWVCTRMCACPRPRNSCPGWVRPTWATRCTLNSTRGCYGVCELNKNILTYHGIRVRSLSVRLIAFSLQI